MTERTCETCRWFKPVYPWRKTVRLMGWCLNPINDQVEDTGTRKAMRTFDMDTCPKHTPTKDTDNE